MPDSTLLSGLIPLALVLMLAALPQRLLLNASTLERCALGLVCGLGAALMALTALQSSQPPALSHTHPGVLAGAALLLGPLAGAVAALAATTGPWLAASAPAAASLTLIASCWALGSLWWLIARRQPLWRCIVGLALTLPPLLLIWSDEAALAIAMPGSWLLWAIPWGHALGALVLCAGAELLQSRAQTLRTLVEREQETQHTLAALGGGRWEWDVPARRFDWDGHFFRLFGLPEHPPQEEPSAQQAERTRALHRAWLERIHPEDALRLQPSYRRMLDGLEPSFHVQFRLRDMQGNWRWILVRAHATERDAQGHVLRLAGMALDVTGERELRAASAASDAKYTVVYQTLPDAAGITCLADGAYLDVNPAFERLLGRTRAQIIGRTSLELGVWANAAERQRLLDGLSANGRINNLPMTASRADGSTIPGLMSGQCTPIDGIECLVFVFHDQREEQRVRTELEASNVLLRQTGAMARLGVWEDVPGQGLVYWSDVCYEIHGLPAGLPLPRPYIDHYVAPPWRASLRAALRHSLRTQRPWSLELQILREDGQAVWVRTRGEPIVEHGRIVRMRGIVQDIDAARRATEQLRASEERLARMFALLPVPLGFSRRSDGHYLDVNPAWERLLGYTRQQALGRTVVDLGIYSQETRGAMLQQAHAQGQLQGYEVELNTCGGERRTVLQSLSPMELDDQPCWLFSVHDITERKRAEQRVHEREQLLSLTLSAAAIGVWDWNMQTNETSGDQRWYALIGQDYVDEAPHHFDWGVLMDTDDRARIFKELQRMEDQRSDHYNVTARMRIPQGGWRWVHSMGLVIARDAQGQPLRMVGVSLDVTQQHSQHEQLQRLAHFDALTGLPNRVQLAQRLQDAMTQARASGTLLCVAYLDLDGFKPVNDRLGHSAGDRLLIHLGTRMTQALRASDCVARLGGDEFALLLTGLHGREDAERKLGQLMTRIATPYPLEGEQVLLTASIGYTLYPEDDADAETLLRHADQAMYQAKQSGRNRFHGFDTQHALHERAQHLQLQQIAQALERQEFVLYLQPKVQMDSGALLGAECLVRWQHPEHGLLLPGAFLPALEGTALEVRFGQWVFEAALACIEQLKAHGLALPLGVNIAAQHLQQIGFAQWISDCLARHPTVAPHQVELEITESAALHDLAHVAGELAPLRAKGLRVALDDFGTGYSSLTYLRRLPMDTLKIDQSFVRDMLTDPGDLTIVQGVVGLAASFGLQVIAEGVETEEQGLRLQQLGCAHAQGYFIARPMPLGAFVTWAAQWQPPAAWRVPPAQALVESPG